MSKSKNGKLPTMDEIAKRALRERLEHCGWDLSCAASTLDLSRSTVYRKATQWGLMKPGPVLVRRLVKA